MVIKWLLLCKQIAIFVLYYTTLLLVQVWRETTGNFNNMAVHFERGTAHVDWCEPNYAISPDIAEFFNTVKLCFMFIWLPYRGNNKHLYCICIFNGQSPQEITIGCLKWKNVPLLFLFWRSSSLLDQTQIRFRLRLEWEIGGMVHLG